MCLLKKLWVCVVFQTFSDFNCHYMKFLTTLCEAEFSIIANLKCIDDIVSIYARAIFYLKVIIEILTGIKLKFTK